MLYEKLMNLPQKTAGFMCQLPALRFIPTKKTGFQPEKIQEKQCGNIEWTDGKITLSWDGPHRYQYPIGRKVYKNGRVFLDLEVINIDGQIMGCAAKGNITVVFLWSGGSINVRFFQGKQPFVHITITSNLTGFMPLQLAAINKSVTKAALLFSDDFINRLILIDLDTANSDPNLWAVKTSETNQDLVGATIPNGFRSAPILAAVDFKEDERVDFFITTEHTSSLTPNYTTNEQSPEKWEYGKKYKFCYIGGDYYSELDPLWGVPDSGGQTYDDRATFRGTKYEAVTVKYDYVDSTFTSTLVESVNVSNNIGTQHFRAYNSTSQARTKSYSGQLWYGFMECGRDQPPQSAYLTSLPISSPGSSSSTNSESATENAYLTFTVDLDLRHDLIATLKFTKNGSTLYTIKIGGDVKHQESKALPMDFDSYYSWFLKLFPYSIYASPFYTFFAVPDPNNPSQTDKYPVLYESGNYNCWDRYANMMQLTLNETGLDKTRLESGQFKFTYAGLNPVGTVYKKANALAEDVTFTETEYLNLIGVV